MTNSIKMILGAAVFTVAIVTVAGCSHKTESTADPAVATRYCTYKVEHTPGEPEKAVHGDIAACEHAQAVNPIKIYADTLEPVKKP